MIEQKSIRLREEQERVNEMVELNKVLSEVNKAAQSAGREGEVTLMAVSKTHPYEDVLSCYNEGQRLFGENRVQEVVAKFPLLADRPNGMKLCLIGHLQKNKVRKILPLVDRIDSVDSADLLLLIEREAARIERTIDVLFEFNSSEESQKAGFETEDALLEAVKLLPECPHVNLLGLMTVGPLGFDKEKNIAAFTRTRNLFDLVKQQYVPSISILSMGMSADYPDAIACGSTEVRIGTAIFGKRNYDV